MAIRKKVLAWLITVVLLCSVLPLGASAERDFPTVLADAKKGVAQIYGLGDNGRILSSWVGTGFAVGKEGKDSDIFLTNWHVVTGNGGYSQSQVRIWILQENCAINEKTGEPDPSRSIPCKVLKTTTGYPDYAIIQATESISGYKALPLLSSKEIQDGTSVYALGYPAVVSSASASHYGIDDITATNGIVSQHMQYALADNTWVLMHTAQISGGNSGGPLITEDGAVIGLNTYGFGESEENMNRYLAVYIDYAMDGLDELGIKYDEYSEKTGLLDKLDSDLAPVLVGGSAAVILAAGVVFFFVYKRRKEEERRREEQRRLQEERRRQEEQRRLEEQRRIQEEQRRRQEEEQRRRDQAPRATLRMNGGRICYVPASGGTMGRDKSCAIVLPENAAGVSRIHCRLDFRGEQLVLTDMNSSYGTIIHGRRIPPNTPVALKPGSSFSLGSEKYTFTVC